MPQVTVGHTTHRGIVLLSRAWSISEDQVVARLLEAFQGGGQSAPPVHRHDDGIRVHARYAGVFVEGIYRPKSGSLEIVDGPAAGQSFKALSGAAIAVVQALNPRV